MPGAFTKPLMKCALNNKDMSECCKTKGVDISLNGADCLSMCKPEAYKSGVHSVP